LSTTSLRIAPLRRSYAMPGLRHWLMLTVALAVVLTLSSMSWATSCSGYIQLTTLNPQITCVMPESNPELPMTVGLKYLSFASQSQGQVLIYDDSMHTELSDIVIFTNVNGVATITFTSNLDQTGTGSTPTLPILGSYTEGSKQGYIFLALALTNGKFLHVGICSSESSTCNGGSDSLKLSVGNTGQVPEPETFILFGTGLFGTGAFGWAKGAWSRHFRSQIRT
jgi:PEP-CTERM motif